MLKSRSYKIFCKDILTRKGILGKKDPAFELLPKRKHKGEKENPPFRELEGNHRCNFLGALKFVSICLLF